MFWQIPIIFRIIFGDLIAPYLQKKISAKPSRSRNLFWQYFFTALFATTVAFFCGVEFNDSKFLIILIIGTFNAFGCYCQWRAIAISLSKTSLFTQADDLIAMTLGYILLHEASSLNTFLVIGVTLCLGAVMIFTYNEYRAGEKIKISLSGIGIWVASYSIIWGIATFSTRYFVLKNMPLPSYIAAWYLGSLVGACIIFLLSSKKEKGQTLTLRQIGQIAPLATTIWISLMFSYWSFMLAPITVVQPILQVSEMTFRTIIGLWVFKEIKELNRTSKIAMIIGLAGGLIIIFSY